MSSSHQTNTGSDERTRSAGKGSRQRIKNASSRPTDTGPDKDTGADESFEFLEWPCQGGECTTTGEGGTGIYRQMTEETGTLSNSTWEFEKQVTHE